MLVELSAGLEDENSVLNLRRVLTLGPWCWPVAGDPALPHARHASGCSDPPAPAVGSVLAVTVGPHGGCLWALRERADLPLASAFGPRAVALWDDAICALPRSLPVLWSSVRRHRERPHPWHLGSHARGGRGLVLPDRTVDGPSVGLAFFLCLASRVLGVPVATDVVASATLDAFGAVGPVDGLEVKIETVVAVAPRVRRLVVAAAQADAAREIARGRVEVLGVRSASEAAELLLSGLAARIVGVDEASRRELVRSFFRLTLGGQRELLDWSPVAKAARMALGEWRGLSDDERYTLEFAAAVAERHQGNRGALLLPPPSWLGSLSTPVRVNVLAHLVQQSADTGEPPSKETLALARKDLPIDAKHGFAPQLRLMGAVARLESFCGNPRRALERQRRLAEIHLSNQSYEDVSQPLCEWVRLAGALADVQSLGDALSFFDDAQALGVFSPADLGYLELARARASVQAERPTPRALEALRRLADDAGVADHVRRSAARWAVACGRALGLADDARVAAARLSAACPESDADGRAFARLGALDGALAAADAAAAEAAVAALREQLPGLVGHLTEDRDPAEAPAHVARFFPY
ncbi:MAG: hypothetical protein U0599_13470 [Vicinamibacteria bacterium]